jgi:transcription initiation factor TFIIIB Brf1 subunit/transcription initiation factor TFIIB
MSAISAGSKPGMACLFPGVQRHKDPDPEPEEWWNCFQSDHENLAHLANVCPECHTDTHIEVDNDESICKKCALSLGFQIDQSAEYRWFGSDDRNPDPTRVGNPLNPLLPESSMGTRILVRPGENKAMRKIRQYHLWNVMPYRERTLWNVFEMLQVRAANAGISAAILDETKQLYAQVSPLCICRGAQKDALMAACLFESLKRHDTPRRPAEIAEIFKINLKHITRGVKQFSGLLDEHLHAQAKKETQMEIPTQSEIKAADSDTPQAPTPVIVNPIATPSTNFRHYLEPAILRLEIPRSLMGSLQDLANGFGNLLDELGVCPETTPPSLAACSISLACQKIGIQKANSEVASVCGISIATLQKCMKRIDPWKPTLFKGMEK